MSQVSIDERPDLHHPDTVRVVICGMSRMQVSDAAAQIADAPDTIFCEIHTDRRGAYWYAAGVYRKKV